MRTALLVGVICGLAPFCLGLHQAGRRLVRPHQAPAKTGFRPVPGETVLELTIEGRGEAFIDLETRLAPKATAHIIALTKQGFYNGQRFFKVLTSPRPYLVQTGDPLSRSAANDDSRLGGGGSDLGKVPYEDTHIPYTVGSVVLATADGNRDSGDSQFYILLGDYSRLLQGTGTVFGRVVMGMETIDHVRPGDKIVQAQILTG